MKAWMLPAGLRLIVRTLGCGEKRSPAEKAAIREIEKLGGSYRCDEESPGRARVEVWLSGTKVIDPGLEHLKRLTRLQVLHTSRTRGSPMQEPTT